MIRTEKGELTAYCEECGCPEHGGTLGFREFVEHLKEQGWEIRKEEDSWLHTCPDCAE